MFSVVDCTLLFVIFVFVRFIVLAVLLISRDIVAVSSSASLSSIAIPPLVSFLNHVIFLFESLRFRFTPDPFVITIVRLLGPDGGNHAAGFCRGSLSPTTFGTIGVVVSFVAGGIQNMSLPRVGDTSYTSFLIISVLYSPSTVSYLCVCSVVKSDLTSCS